MVIGRNKLYLDRLGMALEEKSSDVGIPRRIRIGLVTVTKISELHEPIV